MKNISSYILPGLSISNYTFNNIATIVCKEFGITIEDLKSECKKREITDARKVFSLITSDKRREDVAKYLHKTHGSISTAIKTSYELFKTNREFLKRYKRVENKIGVLSNVNK